LKAHCRQYLAPYKVPARWHCLEALPVNSGGKVMKASLRDMLLKG